MDGIILLLILIPLVIFFLLFTILNRTGAQKQLLESLYEKISQLSREVSSLSKQLKEKKEDTPVTLQPAQVVKEKVIIVEKEVTPLPAEDKIIPAEPVATEKPVAETTAAAALAASTPKPKTPYIPSFRKTEKEEKDLEKYIGENLANKIGIGVLVLGIAFFIKYAIDKNWINESGRVLTGLLCGCILIGLAHRLRHTYRSFSSVLVGGGLSVFYFSIAFAFHQYHLIGQPAAFLLMVAVSVFAVVLSLLYNRQELAILAAVGGFITPFLVSTGNENYVALFIYLCILNAGFTALSWFRRWPAVNIISLFFTTIIFGGWLFKRLVWDDTKNFPERAALLFATLFYVLFITMNIINSLRLKNKFTAFDFIILLGINFLYYAAGMIILDYWDITNGKGFFTLGLGLTNLLLTAIFTKKKSADRNFVSLLTGLSLTFISLSAPVLFKGNHIVLFWAAEMVLLFFLYLRTGVSLLKLASDIVAAAMLISLVLNWTTVYTAYGPAVPVLLNKGFITGLVAAIALFVYARLYKRENPPEAEHPVPVIVPSWLVLSAGIAVLYLTGLLELFHQFAKAYSARPVYAIFLQAYSFAFAVVLLLLFRKKLNHAVMRLAFTVICLALYFYNININQEVSLALLTGYGVQGHFIIHWIADILLCWLLFDTIRYFCRAENNNRAAYRPAIVWVAVCALVILLSIEFYHLVMWIGYRDEQDWAGWKNLYQKAGLSILWGICSFLLMWAGMRKGLRTLRIISLSLFTVTLVKLFVYDIRNIPPGGKIAAFILLGVLLLVVSFMYQRLKKIIIDNKNIAN